MFVYVVVPGDYNDDYCIHGIFTTKEKAEEWIENNKTMYGGQYDIDTYETDPPIDPVKKNILFTGEINNGYINSVDYSLFYVDEPRPIRFYREAGGNFNEYVEGTITVEERGGFSLRDVTIDIQELVKKEYEKWTDENSLVCKPVNTREEVYRSTYSDFDAYVKQFKKYRPAYIHDFEEGVWYRGYITDLRFYDVTKKHDEPEDDSNTDYDYSATFVDNDKIVDVYIAIGKEIPEPNYLKIIAES